MTRTLRNSAALAAFIALGSVCAHAATIVDKFVFTSSAIPGTVTTTLPASPTPSSFVPNVSFTLSDVSATIGSDSFTGAVTFLSAGGASGGGATFTGPVLFSGPTANPTFNLGTFPLSGIADLGDGPQSVSGSLTISQVSTVPEPLTLSMTGTGLLGLVEIFRRRRVSSGSIVDNC